MTSKTSIIISNLNKDDFIIGDSPIIYPSYKSLSFADQIKLMILNHNDTITNHISHWSNLPFLNRIIIIFQNEKIAKEIYKLLIDKFQSLDLKTKVTLQENLLQRSKSSDFINESESLSVGQSLDNFKSFHNDKDNKEFSYEEPKPQNFNVIKDLSKLGIDLNDYNDEEQMKELSGEEEERESKNDDVVLNNDGPPVLRRTSTKTLFKPNQKRNVNLSIDTSSKTNDDSNFPSSPIITLDETF